LITCFIPEILVVINLFQKHKLYYQLIIRLGDLLFGDRYIEAYDAMKADPDNLKKEWLIFMQLKIKSLKTKGERVVS